MLSSLSFLLLFFSFLFSFISSFFFLFFLSFEFSFHFSNNKQETRQQDLCSELLYTLSSQQYNTKHNTIQPQTIQQHKPTTIQNTKPTTIQPQKREKERRKRGFQDKNQSIFIKISFLFSKKTRVIDQVSNCLTSKECVSNTLSSSSQKRTHTHFSRTSQANKHTNIPSDG